MTARQQPIPNSFIANARSARANPHLPKPPETSGRGGDMATLGRPSDYTDETAALICDEIAKGRSVRDICSDQSAEFDKLPSERTVYRWLDDNEAFRQQYARAREAQADGKFEQTWEIAKAATPDNVQVARLQVDTLKWHAGKLAPKKYGDAVQMKHTDGDGGPLTVVINKPG